MGNNTIEITEEQMKELNKGGSITLVKVKPKVWEPKGGNFVITGEGEIVESRYSTYCYANVGSTRETKEEAEKSSKLITKYKRLLAYKDEFDSGFRGEHGVLKYIVVEDSNSKYKVSPYTTISPLLAVAFSQKEAYKLVGKLNSGEVVL